MADKSAGLFAFLRFSESTIQPINDNSRFFLTFSRLFFIKIAIRPGPNSLHLFRNFTPNIEPRKTLYYHLLMPVLPLQKTFLKAGLFNESFVNRF